MEPNITEEQLIIALEKQDHSEWKKYCSDWKFYRRALNRELIGDMSQAVEVAVQQKTLRQTESSNNGTYQNAIQKRVDPGSDADSYLIRQPVESELSYAIRLIFGFDGNESSRVLRTLLGYLLKETTMDWEGLPQDVVQRLQENIDGEGTDWKQFLEEAGEEIGGIGKAFGWIYKTGGDSLPVHEFIPREAVRDWHKDKTNFLYVKFERCRETFAGVIRTETRETVLLTPWNWYFCVNKDKKWTFTKEPFITTEQPYIPFVDGWCGKYAKSIIATAAYLQFLIMNGDSVAFQIIRNQMLGIIVGPTGTREQLLEITTGTVVDVPPESTRSVEIVGFPKSTIDGHAEYLERMSKKVGQSANLRDDSALAASGESKDWDFMPTTSLLDRFADHVENYVNGALDMFLKVAGLPKSEKKRFSIKREFDRKGLRETLEAVFSGLALQLGPTFNDMLKKRGAEAFKQLGIEPTPEQWKQIEEEIARTGRSDTLEKLMEVTINGENNRTSAEAAKSGGREAGDAGDGSGNQE